MVILHRTLRSNHVQCHHSCQSTENSLADFSTAFPGDDDDDDDEEEDLLHQCINLVLVVLVLVTAQSNNNNTDGGFANFDVVPTAVAPSPTNTGGFALTRYQQRRLSFA
jgi:hypothetical protein